MMVAQTKVNKKTTKTVENKLIQLLKKDEKLDREQRMAYISMANLFLEKFDVYMNMTSIEMNKEIPLGIDTWRDFLNYPVVRQYIQSFRDELITKMADKGLMEGDKNAVSIKKVMQDKGPIINNSNIVLIRLPEKVDFE
jgi:hypothetical protein